MRVLFALLIALSLPVFAQQAPRDEIARLQVEHLKEMLALVELKNKQLRDADVNANEQRFKAQEQAVAFALQAAEKAVTKAELAAEKRFESVNEFRNQLKDQTGTFITRNEMWGWLVALIMMGFSAWNILQTYIKKTTKP
jgi:PBP1b-binding outer membrane lipoprotein LpoB